eukprot:8856536-Lingulodinium_polyedra.AAC.1
MTLAIAVSNARLMVRFVSKHLRRGGEPPVSRSRVPSRGRCHGRRAWFRIGRCWTMCARAPPPLGIADH